MSTPIASPTGHPLTTIHASPHHHGWLRFLPVLALAIFLAVIGVVKWRQIATLIRFGKQAQAAGSPPESVGTATAKEDSWHTTLFSVGTVEASRGVSVSNEAPGLVTAIHFQSGEVVKAGQVLIELDTEVERAQLASAVARQRLAETTARRSRVLFEANAIAAAERDADEAGLRAATADASALDATLARKTVRAPFAGRIGIREVNVGQYLNPGTPVAELESSDEEFVDFTVPQQRLADVTTGTTVEIALEGRADAKVEGTIAALEPSVDETTRTVRVRANAKDPKRILRPGMFVGVTVILPDEEKVVVIPGTAVMHAPYGDSVYVLPSDDGGPVKAEQRFVRTGEARGDFVTVVDGLRAGEIVVASGGFKLRNGASVKVDNEVAPVPSLAPKPVNR